MIIFKICKKRVVRKRQVTVLVTFFILVLKFIVIIWFIFYFGSVRSVVFTGSIVNNVTRMAVYGKSLLTLTDKF